MSRNTLRPRRSLCAGLITVMALLSAGQAYADGEGKDTAVWNDQGESRISRGFAIAPVPLKLKGKNRALVGLGSYIVNAQGGCNDCHTNPPYAPGGNPFLGQPKEINAAHYLAGGMNFGPYIISRNLTPQGAEGKPAGYTFEEFLHVLRTGEDLKHLHPQISPLLQVMPWPVYGEMTQRDIRAIYEYLRAIPHAEPGP